jgi:pre-rRNA-processing protein TSR4
MADEYDSDSAHSDASSVTRTNVLLASIEPKLKVNTGTYTSSFAGGYPTFPSLPSSSPSIPTETGIICGHCGAPMPLLSQIYCPMEQGENDRTLYVWACPKADCQRRAGRCVLFTPCLALYPLSLYTSSEDMHELIHHVSRALCSISPYHQRTSV